MLHLFRHFLLSHSHSNFTSRLEFIQLVSQILQLFGNFCYSALSLLFPPKSIRAVLFNLRLDISPDAFHRCAHCYLGHRGSARCSCYYFLFQSLHNARSDARRLRMGVFGHLPYTVRNFFTHTCGTRICHCRQIWQRDFPHRPAQIWLPPSWLPPFHARDAFLSRCAHAGHRRRRSLFSRPRAKLRHGQGW